jgi:CheY-like chemotaxis protein
MVISESFMAKRILIADDSLTIQKAFAMTLGAEEFALTTARSADEGLNLIKQTRPDLVIADATMPGRSGYELCAAVKSDAGLRATPVYILASTQQPYDEGRGGQAGADGHLLKPWDTTALLDRVREALAKGPSGTSASASPVSAAPRPTMSSMSGRPSAALPVAAFDDGFGDVAVEEVPRETAREMPRATAPSMPAQSLPTHTAPAAAPSLAPAAPRPTSHAMPIAGHAPAAAPPAQAAPGMRPSLIPGVRPGVMPPARPGTVPARPVEAAPGLPGAVPPRPAASPAAPPAVGRTLVGLPATNLPIPGSTRPPAAAPLPAAAPVARPMTGPVSPLGARPFTPPAQAPVGPSSLPASPAGGSLVDQKVAAIAARGPEYEALAKLSREVIEKIVWEIVPELAEAIIREQMDKRGRA